MSKKTKKQGMCYISGKITGLPLDEVREKFGQAEKEVSKLGYVGVSPLNNGIDDDAEWGDHIVEDIKMLNRCSAVYFLTNWQDSEGAKIEHTFARNAKKKMIYQKDGLTK